MSNDRQFDLPKVTRRGFAVAALTTFAGCKNFLRRGQSPEEVSQMIADKDPTGTAYVGDITGKWGLNYYKVEGIGLATELRGTGSDSSPSSQRTYVMDDLLARQIPHPKELLAGKDTSVVLVRGFLPPGVQKGDRFDIEIGLMPRSETSSLRGGMLMPTSLMPFEYLGSTMRTGHTMANAKGAIIVDAAFESDEEALERKARIIGGGIATRSRPLGLVVRGDSHSVRTTATIARRINDRFHVIFDGAKSEVAEAKNDRKIELKVPKVYRKNISRYLAVIQNIAFKSSLSEINRIERLADELSEPSSAAQASLRLEAIGKNAVGSLQRGARATDMEVKFYSAESLAYLGESSAAEVLGSVAQAEPAFRWRAMTALASMDSIEAGIALTDLLHSDSAETRYAAFRALHYRSPMDPTIRQQRIPDTDFSLHLVASEGPQMIHFAKSERPEIVLFGHDQRVNDQFLYIGSGLTVRSSGDGGIEIKTYARSGNDSVFKTSAQVADVMRQLMLLGVNYDEMIDVFRNGKSASGLDSQLVIDATPKAGRRYNRSIGIDDTDDGSSRYVSGPIPELFRSGLNEDRSRRERSEGVELASFEEEVTSEETQRPPSGSFFERMQKKWDK